jgi:hypothetical protein
VGAVDGSGWCSHRGRRCWGIGRPFLTENEPLWRFFAPELRERLSELDAQASVTDRVRAALHETLPAGDAGITAVTAKLAVSAGTLQ